MSVKRNKMEATIIDHLSIQRTLLNIKVTKRGPIIERNVGMVEVILITCIFIYTYYIYSMGDDHVQANRDITVKKKILKCRRKNCN